MVEDRHFFLKNRSILNEMNFRCKLFKLKPWATRGVSLSVGGGTSGSVLANRLSESPDVTVLLLEAGGLDSDPDIQIPLLSSLERKLEHTWKFTTTPQEHAFISLDGKVSK